jgi:peptide/nickel transport system permease protein
METPNTSAADPGTQASPGYWKRVAARLAQDPTTLFFGGIVLLIIASAILAPWVTGHDPNKTNMFMRLQPIGGKFVLGTDELGRDVLTRIVYGGRVSLVLGIVPVVIAAFIGGALGIAAGFFGGRINSVIMRVMDMLYAFPSLLLAIALSGMTGPGMKNGLLSLTVVFIPSLCRVAETAATQVRRMEFVEAARATGASTASVLFGQVVSNVVAPIFVYAAGLMSVSILLAAGLSFLGLGVEPPTPDWGSMLANMRQSIYVNPWVCALPGVAIFLASLSFNMVSDGLRHAMETR